MIHQVENTLKSIHRNLFHYRRITRIFQGINSRTYSIGKKPVKSKFSIYMDHLYLFFILKILPVNYYLFQFDCKKRKEFKEYMDEPVSSPFLKHKLYNCLWDDNYSSLVNDKYVFHCFCRYHNLPVPQVYGVYLRGSYIGRGKDISDLISRENIEQVIIKPLRGIQGKGIHIVSRDTLSKLERENKPGRLPNLSNDLRTKQFIVQEVIKQHPELNRINPNSVNTLRILTLLTTEGEVELLSAILRTSAGQSYIDNFKSGGIVIGVDIQTGRLKKHGFMSPEHGTIVSQHPVTGVPFGDFNIPYWSEVKTAVVKAQKAFHYLKSIAWDMAISPDGPILVEGNIEWGTAGIQAANGGLLTQKNRMLFSNYGLTF